MTNYVCMYVVTIAVRKEEESIEKFLCEHPVLLERKLRYLGTFFLSRHRITCEMCKSFGVSILRARVNKNKKL